MLLIATAGPAELAFFVGVALADVAGDDGADGADGVAVTGAVDEATGSADPPGSDEEQPVSDTATMLTPAAITPRRHHVLLMSDSPSSSGSPRAQPSHGRTPGPAPTRQHIAHTAAELVSEHGIEQVSVADVARGAEVSEVSEVSEQTLRNHFSPKHDLVLDRAVLLGDAAPGTRSAASALRDQPA